MFKCVSSDLSFGWRILRLPMASMWESVVYKNIPSLHWHVICGKDVKFWFRSVQRAVLLTPYIEKLKIRRSFDFFPTTAVVFTIVSLVVCLLCNLADSVFRLVKRGSSTLTDHVDALLFYTSFLIYASDIDLTDTCIVNGNSSGCMMNWLFFISSWKRNWSTQNSKKMSGPLQQHSSGRHSVIPASDGNLKFSRFLEELLYLRRNSKKYNQLVLFFIASFMLWNCYLLFVQLQIQQLLADMRDIYSRNRVCPYVKQPKNVSLPIRPDSIKCNLALDPGMIIVSNTVIMLSFYLGFAFSLIRSHSDYGQV